ncbi:UNKNOWN [Stylonychia lemnae]|uniref:Cyclin C-terminal domain-containing protein n=1 Tax=Stylonychia lemnae TaxID=5949 RepID=A0A078B6R8_STYLE|nr:UNKNOWN [Stylonychia lemnae]|eukprot:CDW90074.1 UNKNOWN [Stylonychia lemnae]
MPNSTQNQNYSVVLTQNYCSVDVQPPLPQIYCDHKSIVKQRSQKSDSKIKRYCSKCGCFIAQNGLTTVKELGFNFQADISPIEQYETILEDEQFMSYFHYYQTHTSIMSESDKADLNSLVISDLQKSIQDRNSSGKVQNGSMLQAALVSDKQRVRKLALKAQMCLLLASKYDELDDRIPMIRDFQKLARYEFAYKECKDEEELVLNQLNWNLQFLTPVHSIQSLQSLGIVFEDDRIQSELDSQNTAPLTDKLIRDVRRKSDQFADLSAKSEWEFQLYPPSVVGLSCILAARFDLKIVPMWNEKFQEITGYTIDPYNEIFECFEKLYSLYDQNYKSIKLSLFCKIKTQKSLLSTCEPNPNGQTNDSIHIHQNNRKSKILESNMNIINDSFIVQKGSRDIRDTSNTHLNEYEYNDENDLGDESMLSKKLIDQIPSLQNSNKQSHILFNNVPSAQQSQRSSVSHLNLQKPGVSNQTKQSIIRDSQKLVQKRKYDLAKVNKENQQAPAHNPPTNKNNSKSKPVQKSCRLSSNPGNKYDDLALKLQSIDSTKNFNTSQLMSMPVTRCTTNISHVNNHLNSTTNSQAQNKNMNLSLKQRNQSASNLHAQQANNNQQQQAHIPGAYPQKSMIKLNLITQKVQSHHHHQQQQQNQTHQKIGQVPSSINHNITNLQPNRVSTIKSQNNSRSRKQSICSGSSITRYQYNASIPKQSNCLISSSIVNQKLRAHQSSESILKVDQKAITSKSNRQSTSNVKIEVSKVHPQRDSSSNNQKITELVQKYQSENTIYEKSLITGRNSNLSMLGGFQAHSKTFAALHNTIAIQHNSSIERSASECDNHKSIPKRENQKPLSQSLLNGRVTKSGDRLQFQTIQEPRKTRIAIMEEENEGEKSNIEFDQTQLQINYDEFQVAEEDSVVIKRPMSSKKSKSLENVNKLVKNRKASVTSKAIIELYKKQYQQQSTSQCDTRNYSVQQPTKTTTVDMSYNNEHNHSKNHSKDHFKNNVSGGSNPKTNYIKKNINFISVLNNHAMISLENSNIIDQNRTREVRQEARDNSNAQSKRNSRCQMYPQQLLSYNQINQPKNMLFSNSSISQSRFDKNKHHNTSTSNNQSLNARGGASLSKSNQPSNKALLQNKSQAIFIDERKSYELSKLNQDYFVLNPETTLEEVDQDETLQLEKVENANHIKVRTIQYAYNLSASSSQIHLKERPYHRFLNQDSKQNFKDFSKNFKEKAKKSPVQSQVPKLKFETIKIKIISPKGLEEKSPKVQQLKSQQFISKNDKFLKNGRRASNQSLNLELQPHSGLPPLSHRSNQSNNNIDKSYQIMNTSSTQSLVKYHKFQARKPQKTATNHSLIEQALLKKSKLHSILKPFESYQAPQTLDNTYETTFDEKNNSSYANIPQVQNIPKNRSINRSSLMIPVLNQQQIQHPNPIKNMSLIQIKSPHNVQQCSNNNASSACQNAQQDIPPAPGYNAKQMKHSQVLKSNNKLQKSIEKSLPTIQAPVSARVSNRYNELSTKDMVIKEEDEYRQITGLFKKATLNGHKYYNNHK